MPKKGITRWIPSSYNKALNWFCTLKISAWIKFFKISQQLQRSSSRWWVMYRLNPKGESHCVTSGSKDRIGKSFASAEYSKRVSRWSRLHKTWCICWFWWLDSCRRSHPTFYFVFWVEASDRLACILHYWPLSSASSSSRSGPVIRWYL